MPRGTPLTPEELGRAAEVYARTGSYSEAARAIGAPDPSTVRKAFLRAGNPNRSQLHAREIDAGLERGRRALDGIVREVRERTRTSEQRSTLTLDELLAAAKSFSTQTSSSSFGGRSTNFGTRHLRRMGIAELGTLSPTRPFAAPERAVTCVADGLCGASSKG